VKTSKHKKQRSIYEKENNDHKGTTTTTST